MTTMTVGEMIEHLQQFDAALPIVLKVYGCGQHQHEDLHRASVGLSKDIRFKGRVKDRPDVVAIDAEFN